MVSTYSGPDQPVTEYCKIDLRAPKPHRMPVQSVGNAAGAPLKNDALCADTWYLREISLRDNRNPFCNFYMLSQIKRSCLFILRAQLIFSTSPPGLLLIV